MTNSEMRVLAEKSFRFFARLMQGEGWMDKVHHELAVELERMVHVEGVRRLAVLMPRGSFKTSFCSKLFPVWLAIRDRETRVLVVSNTMQNARSKVAEMRTLIATTPVFRAVFPDLIPDLRNARWSDAQAEVARGENRTHSQGTFEAAGVGTRLIGRHYDWIVEDDTVAPGIDAMTQEMVLPTQEEIEKAIGWHRSATPLLNNPYTGGRIVVGTRWAFNDLFAYIQEHEDGYRWFRRSAVEDGKPIMPKFQPVMLEDISRTMGEYMFRTLYLNDPPKPGDLLFTDVKILDDLPEDGKWVVTCDPAISEKNEACDTAVIRALHKSGAIHVDALHVGKLSPHDTVTCILDEVERDVERTKVVGIESVAYQRSLAMEVTRQLSERRIYIPVLEIKTRRSKQERIGGLQPLNQRGLITMRSSHGVLRTQMLQYPRGRRIDALDCLAMQLECYSREQPLGRSKPKLREPVDKALSTDGFFKRMEREYRRRERHGICAGGHEAAAVAAGD